jgi:prophage antirepressor-like protein
MNIRTFTFENKTLQVVSTEDRPSVTCSDLERMMGYAPKSLSNRVRAEWADEFIEGRDFAVVTNPVTKGKSLVFFESGFDLVCIKTTKPIGKRLRRFWADEIAPRLRRGQPGAAPA